MVGERVVLMSAWLQAGGLPKTQMRILPVM